MGNSHSQQTSQPPTEVVRRPPIRPNAPPSSRPLSELGPKGPSYHSPENMVLPKDIPVMKLRPVSMELSKYHPEYKELFNYGDEEENMEDKENMIDDDNDDLQKLEKLGTSPPRPPPPILKNGSVSTANVKPNMPLSSNGTPNQMPNGNVSTGTTVSNNINNTTVSTNGKANVPYRPSHRRQISLGQEQHIIMEEPEENIDSRMKLDPLMQSFPGATGPSLPVKNNFNLDYSYQLTYVQLAEHRRNKTIEDLEKRTGKKVSDLSADLNENQEQPFKRAAPSRISSKSTGSGGSALSSKKKKAPAPPGESAPDVPVPPPPPITGASNTLPLPSKNKVKVQNQPYSIENEPPADYEIDSPRKEVGLVLPRYKVVSRESSSVSQSTPSAILSGKASSQRTSAPVTRNNSLSMGKPEIILKRTPSLNPVQKEPSSADEEVPWLLQIRNLSETMSARRQQSMESSDTPKVSKEQKMETDEEINDKVQTNVNSPQAKMIFESSPAEFKVGDAPEEEKDDAKNDDTKKEETISQEEKETSLSPKLTRHASTLGFEQTPTTKFQRQSSEPSSLSAANQADPVRRLNSLLQHDIKAAANAKCHKLKKQVTPVPPKPKDPHEVFREQLAKACAQRDERVKVEGTIDEKLKQTDQDTARVGKVKETSNERKDSTTSSEAPETLPKPPRYHKNVSMNRNTSTYDRRQASQNLASNYRASTALDWTPEDDLDSDDNLSDRETVTSRKTSSDGFKSTIIPKNVNDLKGKKKIKKEKKAKIPVEDENNKQKFGSVKKFKKSMHKSVRNAFGSISKASGRLLRKQKTEDLEQVEDTPKSWNLSQTDVRPSRIKASGKTKISMIPQDNVESESEGVKEIGENEDLDDMQMKETEQINSEEETSEDDSVEDNIVYKNKSSSASAKKLTAREQRYMYDSEEVAVIKYKERKMKQMKEDRRIQEELEKESEAATLKAIEEVREKERKLEAERRKQLEMELELHKIREAETRERLQRLENAHLQQQLNAHLIQQQQQNMSMQLSAPPLPPAGNFNQNYGIGPEAAQAQAFTNLFGTQIPQNGYQTNYGLYHPTQTGSVLNGTVPGVTYDINDYMRMLGVQTPPTSQQMAYFLNSVTLTGQPFERKSNPTLMDVINQQDPMKQYMSGHVNYQLPDTTTKKQGFHNWASTPNMNLAGSASNTVPMTDYVPSYSSLNGANTQDGNKDKQKVKSRNPLYNSDDSDEGLSPHRTVIRARVDDFRKLPVRTESGKFMRQYGSSSYISKQNDNSIVNEQTDKSLTNGLSHANNIDTGHDDRVSPSNSTSTFDSAITSPSVTLSTPSSPSRSVGAPASPMVMQRSDGNGGFRTILDCTAANSKTQITMIDGPVPNS